MLAAKRAINAASRTVSTAVRAARRQPVATLLIVAAVAALVYVLTKRREGWEFDEGSKKRSKKQEQKMYDLCKGGLTWGDISSDSKFAYFAKYNRDAMYGSCTQGWADAKQMVDGGNEGAGTGGCKKVCDNALLRKTKPCLNGDGTKCCERKPGNKYGLHKCIAKDRANKRNTELTGGGGGGGVVPSNSFSSGGGGGAGSSAATDKVWVYEHSNFNRDSPTGGKFWGYTKRDGNASSIGEGLEDNISSVKVPPGMTATLYEHRNWGGKRLVLPPGDYPNLSVYKFGNVDAKGGEQGDKCNDDGKDCWNDIASSIKVS